MKKVWIIGMACGLLLTACGKKQAGEQDFEEAAEAEEVVAQPEYRYGICVDSLDMEAYQVKRGDTFSKIYDDLGFTAVEADRIVRASAELLPPRYLLPGMEYWAFTTRDSVPRVAHVVFGRSKTDFVVLGFPGDSVTVRTFTKPETLRRLYAEGTVETSLWDAIVGNGTDPIIALMLSDIYAWQVDFFGVQPGDGYKVIYQKAYVDDTVPLGVRSIEGAVFTHMGRDYVAIPFVQDSARIFFDPEGNSMRRAFLKSPLDFFRITSRFTNSRYHPVLKRYRAHHGVDYAAPIGTPVKSIGDGRVVAKGYQPRGGGYYLKVKHNSVYTTTYMHLSRYAKGINKGTRVQQGQVIAYVGSTGLSTGPHLDFRVQKNGSYINPLTMEAPPDIPLHEELRDSFNVVKAQLQEEIATCHAALHPAPADSAAVDLPGNVAGKPVDGFGA